MYAIWATMSQILKVLTRLPVPDASLAALMTRISSVVIEGAHTSTGAATLARTVPFWGRFRSPREPTAGPCRGCLLPSAKTTAPSRHHLLEYRLSCVMVRMSKRHHLSGSWDLKRQTREPVWVVLLWGEAGAPGGTVRRAAVRKRGSGSISLY